MTEEGKEKFVALVGALGWVLSAAFMVLFFVVLRPSVFRDGQVYGEQSQKRLDQEKAEPYFSEPFEKDTWLAGIILEVNEDSIIVETSNAQTNPLKDEGNLKHRLVVSEASITFFSHESFGGDPARPQERIGKPLTLSDLKVGQEARYLVSKGQSIYEDPLEVQTLHIYEVDAKNQNELFKNPLE